MAYSVQTRAVNDGSKKRYNINTVDPAAMIAQAMAAQDANYAQQNKKETAKTVVQAPVNTSPAGTVGGYAPAASKTVPTTNTAQPATATAVQTAAPSVEAYSVPTVDVESIYNEARTQREEAAQKNKDTLLKSLSAMYANATGNVNRTADEAQRQNFVESQIQQRNLGQQMAASGLSGGAAETTLLGLANAYGNNRRMTESERLQQVGALEDSYAEQKAAAETDYSTRMSEIAGDYAAQIAAARQAEADRQAQLLAQKYAADVEAQQAAADRQLKLQLAAAEGNAAQAAAGGEMYSDLGVSAENRAAFANDIDTVSSGYVDKKTLAADAAGLIAQYGAKGYEYLYKIAPDAKQSLNSEQQSTVDAIAAAIAAANRNQAMQNAMYR